MKIGKELHTPPVLTQTENEAGLYMRMFQSRSHDYNERESIVLHIDTPADTHMDCQSDSE